MALIHSPIKNRLRIKSQFKVAFRNDSSCYFPGLPTSLIKTIKLELTLLLTKATRVLICSEI